MKKNILGEFYILFTGEFSLWSGINKDFLKTLKEIQIDLTVVPPLFMRDMFQNPYWMSDTADSTKPKW